MSELKIKSIYLPLSYNHLEDKRLDVFNNHCEVYNITTKRRIMFTKKTNIKTNLTFWQDQSGSMLVMTLGIMLLDLGGFFLFLCYFDPSVISRADVCLVMIFSGLLLLKYFFGCEKPL